MPDTLGKLRLGLDLGSNSIGWVLFRLDEEGIPSCIEKSGVRIFSNSRNAKTNIPLSVERREARGMRRRRDRFLQRKRGVLNLLRRKALLPSDAKDKQSFANMDPYLLRHEALTRPLDSFELARVILHLSQRRGFKSNRKDAAKEEGGKSLGEKISSLRVAIAESGAKTLGSFLYGLQKQNQSAIRMRTDKDWYPNRELYQNEFHIIREAQERTNLLSFEDWDRLDAVLFFQRPLKKQTPGRCRFKPELDRGYRALPSYQRFRIYQQFANLRILQPGKAATSLSASERDILIKKVLSSKQLNYDDARKLIKRFDVSFNLEGNAKSFRAAKHLFGDRTSSLLSSKNHFGKEWHTFPLQKQDEIVTQILDQEDEGALRSFLSSQANLSDEQLTRIVNLSESAFERGYAEFSGEILRGLSISLQENPNQTYDEAAKMLGFHHSDYRPETLRARLPYYGEALASSVRATPNSKVEEERKFGKISNPTVHAALNQLRKIMNALLERYGRIDQIVVEVARDLPLGEKGIKDLASEVKENEKKNDDWRKRLEEHGLANSYSNRLRLRLWEELSDGVLDRRCPYSGDRINFEKLFTEEVEVEHILPRSRTFSNHHSNLTLCSRRANKFKGDRSPYEAFSSADSPFDYDEILTRITSLPLHKQRKFGPDAMEEFSDQNAFLERQLNDTRFIAKATCQYLLHVCPRVMTSRGRLTAFLRSEMDLNKLLSADRKKNRNDHRHHAIDAFLVGLSEPKTLLMLEKALRNRRQSREKLTQLTEQLRFHLQKMIVSHRVDHSVSTKLFEEMAYGKLPNTTDKLVRRVEVSSITKPELIIDERIRNFVIQLGDLKQFDKEQLAQLVRERFGAKKVKIVKKDASAVQLKHPRINPKFSKWMIPLDVHKIEFWKLPGSKELTAVPFTSFEASSREVVSKRPHPAAKKALVLHKGDTVRVADGSSRERTVIIESLRPAGNQILFQDHHVGKADDSVGRTLTFNRFAEKKLRVVFVSDLGEIRDPGPRWINDSKNSGDSNPR